MRPQNLKSKAGSSTPPAEPARLPAVASTSTYLWQAALLFLLSIGIYSNTLQNEYAVDDTLVLTENRYTLQGLKGIPDLMSRDAFEGYFGERGAKLVSGGRYRPLSMVTLAIEYEFYGLKPARSHAINLGLFAFTVLLIYFLLRRLFPSEEEQWFNLPFVAALLFALHPIHTEAVANIKGRDEIMGMLFSIATLFTAVVSVQSRKIWLLLPASVLYFTALLSKENAITFLAVVPLTYWFFTHAKRREYIMTLLAMIVPAAVFLGIRQKFTAAGLAEVSPEILNNPFAYATIAERYATTLYTFVLYLKLLLFPHPLTHDYYFNQIPYVKFDSFMVWFSVALHLAALVWALSKLAAAGGAAGRPAQEQVVAVQQRPSGRGDASGTPDPRKAKSAAGEPPHIYAWSVLYYLITFSVVSNLLFTVGVLMNERFIYMSSLGFCVAFAAFLTWKKLPYALAMGILLITSGLYAAKTWTRNSDWKNNFVLFSTDVVHSPNSAKVQTSIGGDLTAEADKQSDQGRRNAMLREAIVHLEKALSIYPGHSNAMLLLGNARYKLNKDADEALRIYSEANRMRGGGFYDAQYNLGCVFAESKRPAEAIDWFLQAVQQRDDKFELMYNLGDCYFQIGKSDSAIYWLGRALAINPNSGLACYKLGTTYGRLAGNLTEAIRYLKRAVELSPAEPVYREDLAVAYGLNKQFNEAIQTSEALLKIKPDYVPALMNLSVTYRMLGQSEKADSLLEIIKTMQTARP